MSEFIAAMSDQGSLGRGTNHSYKGVLAGNIEAVRERLAYALERVGYRVISEQPLMARRGDGASSCSFDVLRTVKSLTVGLKELNDTSTLVTFDYEITNSMVTKGDRRTVELQAEAVLALAAAGPAAPICSHCGTTNSDDSRFCRACGRPHQEIEPTELEVLRLTSGARPAYQSIITALIMALFVAAVSIPLIFLSSKGPKGGLILLILGEAAALFNLILGLRRLHTTLNPKPLAGRTYQDEARRTLPPARNASLPSYTSVTEGTTELLSPREKERVPVTRRKVDTAEIR